ncbi:MAG: hypothetical protein WDN67_02850 [Candidatus Moraniibacteriota bacterium]
MSTPFKVLVLNASLKHGPNLSNTEEVTNLVLEKMKAIGAIEAETLRLSDMDIPVGLGYKESETDEWPQGGGENGRVRHRYLRHAYLVGADVPALCSAPSNAWTLSMRARCLRGAQRFSTR